MLRVKNEEVKILPCLSSIVEYFDEIIIVDNGSTDNTQVIVKQFIKDHPDKNINFYSYPYRMAKFGDDHLSTPENSLHNMAYYTNWCISKCQHKWIFKWDGDMILPKKNRSKMKQLLATVLNEDFNFFWDVKGQTVYIDQQGDVLEAVDEINQENMVFLNTSAVWFRKAEKWELITSALYVPEKEFPSVLFYETKDTRENEFINWTDLSNITKRKRREILNFNAVKDNSYSGEEFITINREDLYM